MADTIKIPSTPLSALPDRKRKAITKAMLKFIQDTHGAMSCINSEVRSIGVETALETLESLYDTGIMRFKTNKKQPRYGFDIFMYDDEQKQYSQVSNLWKEFQNLSRGGDNGC